MAVPAVAAAPVIKPKASRDDWHMRAFMGVIGLYLVIALALPLYAILSKSFENDDGEFIGLANYIEYFGTPALAHSINNSLFIAVIVTVITVTVAFSCAVARLPATASSNAFKDVACASASCR